MKKKIFLLISCFAVLLSACQPSLNLGASFEILGTTQNRAEEYVRILKTDWTENSDEYIEGRSLYIEAASQFNGCVDSFVISLKSGDNNTTSLENCLDDAEFKSDQFVEYVHALRTPNSSPAPLEYKLRTPEKACPPDVECFSEITVKVLLITVPLLIEAGEAIWVNYQNAKKSEKESIIQELKLLKWKSFDEITVR